MAESGSERRARSHHENLDKSESASQENPEVAPGFRSLATQIQKENEKGKEIPQVKFTAWHQSHKFQEWKHDFCRDVANG